MSFYEPNSDLAPDTLVNVLEQVTQRTDHCIKLVDRSRRVTAVNARGLDLLDAEADAICGRVWTEFWDGLERKKAEHAVETAFAGDNCTFTAHCAGTPHIKDWHVELMPLEKDGDGTRTILIISTPADRAAPRDILNTAIEDATRRLHDCLHSFSNLTSAAGGGARILTRAPNGQDAPMVAENLAASAVKAADAIDRMRSILDDLEALTRS